MSEDLIPAAVAVDLPDVGHELHVDDHGQVTWACDAPVGSRCRLVCAVDCGAEQWPCSDIPDDDGNESPDHPMHDSGECHVVLFLAEGDPVDTFQGDHEPWPLRSGRVLTTWEDDYYGWTYTASPEAASAP